MVTIDCTCGFNINFYYFTRIHNPCIITGQSQNLCHGENNYSHSYCHSHSQNKSPSTSHR